MQREAQRTLFLKADWTFLKMNRMNRKYPQVRKKATKAKSETTKLFN